MENGRKVGVKALVSYGCGDLYGGGSFLIISTLFMFFLTDVIGLPPALAGTVVFAGKFWDAISDPLMGCISDRTKSKWGRRRVYFLAGIIPVFVSFASLWISVKTGNPVFDFLYYFFAYLFFCTVSTMVMVPYSTLPTEMTSDYRLRTRLSGARLLFSQISALLAGTIPGYLVKNLYRDDPAKGFLLVGIFFGIFYALPWIVVYLGTWEAEGREQVDSSVSLGQSFKAIGTLLEGRSFRLHIGMYLTGYTAMDLLSALFIYYLTYYVGKGESYTLCLGSMLIAQLLVLPLYLAVANRIGKGRTFAIGAAIIVAVACSFFGIGSGTAAPVLYALSAFLGAGLSAVVAMPWAMLPESTDADELIHGSQRCGAVAGAFTLSRKLVQAFVLWLVGLSLQAIGYVSDAVQTTSTLMGIKFLFTVLPLSLVAVGAVLAIRYPVTPATFRTMRDELDRRRTEKGAERSPAEMSEDLERITGLSRDRLARVAARGKGA